MQLTLIVKPFLLTTTLLTVLDMRFVRIKPIQQPETHYCISSIKSLKEYPIQNQSYLSECSFIIQSLGYPLSCRQKQTLYWIYNSIGKEGFLRKLGIGPYENLRYSMRSFNSLKNTLGKEQRHRQDKRWVSQYTVQQDMLLVVKFCGQNRVFMLNGLIYKYITNCK